VNVKPVRRLYCLEGLQIRLNSPRRRVMAKLRSDRSDATGPNQVWAMDWMHDEPFDGRRLRVLTVVDTWSRICPVMRVCHSATAMEVIGALNAAKRVRSAPHDPCQSTWLWTELMAEGLPMICLDARHAKNTLDIKVNKTDANDAEGLAHLVRAG
jgi:putative transposase